MLEKEKEAKNVKGYTKKKSPKEEVVKVEKKMRLFGKQKKTSNISLILLEHLNPRKTKICSPTKLHKNTNILVIQD